jgi:hypothetical protein
MKIILNLKDYLVANHIKFITRNQKSIDEIDRGFIGFLSVDNGFINMRRIVEEGVLSQYTDHRHLVYNIYNSVDNNHRFYIIGKNVDTSRRIKLYICEGAFDVLGLYYNILQYRYEDNVVIGSAGGKEYLTLIRFFLCEMGLIDVEIHLCPDSDIEQYKMDRIKEFLRPLYIPVYVHRNVAPGEKDFGVSRDRINEGIMKMI